AVTHGDHPPCHPLFAGAPSPLPGCAPRPRHDAHLVAQPRASRPVAVRVREHRRAVHAAARTVNYMVPFEGLPFVHGLPAPPAQVTVPVQRQEPAPVSDVLVAEAALGGGATVTLPVRHY